MIAGTCRSLERAYVRTEPGDPHEPGAVLEGAVQIIESDPSGAQEVQQDPWVDRAGARPHHQALKRGESHRRLHRAAFRNGCHRTATAEMRDQECQFPGRAPQELAGLLNGPRHR